MSRSAVVVASFVFFAACASTSAVDRPTRQVTGTAGDVRVDAEIGTPRRAGQPIPITYVITNERPAPITIADVASETKLDAATDTATVKIGVHAPGTTPRWVRIAPGEKKTFNTVARLTLPTADADAAKRTQLRLQVNFVDDARAEAVYTNAIAAYE